MLKCLESKFNLITRIFTQILSRENKQEKYDIGMYLWNRTKILQVSLMSIYSLSKKKRIIKIKIGHIICQISNEWQFHLIFRH